MPQASTASLEEVKIPIDLGFGIDTKTDPKLILKTKLTRLENAVINNIGQITKRPGTQSLPNVDTNGLPINSGQALGALDNELLMVGQGNLYSFNEAQGLNFSPKGPLTTVGVNRRIFQSNLANLQSVNAATANGVTVYAYDSAAGNFLSWIVVDESSGTIYQQGPLATIANAQQPQFVTVGGVITMIYCRGAGVFARQFNTLTPWVVPGEVTMTGLTASAARVIGVGTDGISTIFVAVTNNTPGITVGTYNATGLTNIANAALLSGFGPPFISVSYLPVAVAGCNWGLCYPDAAGNLYAAFYSTNLATFQGGIGGWKIISGTAANLVGPSCLRQSPTQSTQIIVYATVYNSQSGSVLSSPCGQSVQHFAIYVTSGARWTPFPWTGVLGAQLASFPWSTGVANTANILVQYQVDPTITWNNPATTQPPLSAQPTHFILDADTGVIVGHGVPAQAMVAGFSLSGPASYPVLPQAASLGSNRFLLGLGASLLLESQGSTFVFGEGVGELILDYGLARAIFLEKLNSNSHVTGGMVHRYDGVSISEHGFLLAPEFLQVQAQTSTQGEVASLIDVQFSPPTVANPIALTTITFPPGAQMSPGDWWALDASGSVLDGLGGNLPAYPTHYFWYSVNGVGTDPAPIPGATSIQVAILSTDTSLLIAQKTAAVVPVAALIARTPTTQNGVAVLEVGISTPVPASGVGLTTIPTVQCGKFRVSETIPAANGGISTTSRAYSIACCPGAFISPGQFFQFNAGQPGGVGGASYVAYVWYSVNGSGTDPQVDPVVTGTGAPSAKVVGIQVAILASDTASAIATKTYNAIRTNATIGPLVYVVPNGVIPASASNGNFVFLSLVTNSSAGQADAVVPEIGAPSVLSTAPILTAGPGSGALGLGGANGLVNQSAYGYFGVYAEVDGKGNIHRRGGGPDDPSSLSVNCPRSPLTDARLNIIFPNLHLTNKTNVILELYRTAADGTTPYKITPSLTPIANNTAALTTTIPDSLQDQRVPGDTVSAELTTNEILYTDGGNLQHDVMAPAAVAHVHRGRVWLGGFADDRQRLQASILEPQGRGVAFSNDTSHTLELTPDGGDFVTFGSLDDKLVIFKQRQIYWTAGDGPDSTGQNGAFLVPEKVMAEVGCDAPKSVVEIPAGLLFSSEKGWFLLDRNLAVTHIEEADGYNNYPVTSGTVDDAAEQVRWTTLNGPTLCFNYARNAWSINDNAGALDSIVYAPQVPGQPPTTSVYYYVTADGKVHQETPGTYTDDGNGYALLLQTAWIKPGDQVEGFARCRKAIWTGLWPALQYSQLTIEYNYNENGGPAATTGLMNLTATGNGGFWGDGASWGADASWGGPALIGNDVVRWRSYPTNPKGTAFRFTLQDIYPFLTTRAVQVANLTLAAGIKRGLAKLGPTTQSIGS
jgi:hypothetical protein